MPQNPPSTNVYSVPVLQSGEGYTTAPTITFAGGCTTEPTATAHIGNVVDDFGAIDSGRGDRHQLLTQGGSGCTSDPVVNITGDGDEPAVAFASIATLSQQDPTWDTGPVGQLRQLLVSARVHAQPVAGQSGWLEYQPHGPLGLRQLVLAAVQWQSGPVHRSRRDSLAQPPMTRR